MNFQAKYELTLANIDSVSTAVHYNDQYIFDIFDTGVVGSERRFIVRYIKAMHHKNGHLFAHLTSSAVHSFEQLLNNKIDRILGEANGTSSNQVRISRSKRTVCSSRPCIAA